MSAPLFFRFESILVLQFGAQVGIGLFQRINASIESGQGRAYILIKLFDMAEFSVDPTP